MGPRRIPLSMLGIAMAASLARTMQDMALVKEPPQVTTAAQQRRKDPTATAVAVVDHVVGTIRDRVRRHPELELAIMARAAAKRERRRARALTAVAAGGMIAA